MGLTPIQIPGKRKRETTKAAVEARKALKRKPGRPLKLPVAKAETDASSEMSETIKKPKKRTLRSMGSGREMSVLEKLPIELLEKVFLHCLNLDLPRSSPIIAGKLSSPMVFVQTVMAAFGPTWHGFVSVVQPPVEEMEDSYLQSAVLRCRWASLPLVLKAKDTWMGKYDNNRGFKPKYFMENALNPPIPDKMIASEYFEADFMTFMTFVTQAQEGMFWKDIIWDTNKDLARGVEIPHSLLCGPWSEEKVRYLYWIIKSGGHIDWHSSTNGEVALEGLKDAVREGNIAAIHILEWAGLAEKLDIEALIFAIRNAGGDKFATVNQFLKVGFDPISSKDARKLWTELSDMRDEAIRDEDEEKLGFVKAILNSPTLKPALNFT